MAMDMALWILQGLLALLFLAAGGMKLFAQDRYREQVGRQNPDLELGLSRGLVTFIGLSEVAGALGFVLPAGTSVLPALTPLAAAGLAVVMILAIRFHLRRREPMVAPAVLLVLCAVVAVGRGLG